MTAPYAARQQPCPDCGAPVRPDVDQLCPACGYPLMFLRPQAAPDARSVARAPGERDDATGVLPPPGGPAATRVSPAVGAGPPPGPAGRPALTCPRCGYGNEAVRVRCERCGHELRPARPQPTVLGPAAAAPAAGRTGWWWWLLLGLALLVLVVLTVWLLLTR